MTPEQRKAMEMARVAYQSPNMKFYPGELAVLERFAAIVTAAEREACAKVCEELVPGSGRNLQSASVWDCATFDCAAAIRARGDA